MDRSFHVTSIMRKKTEDIINRCGGTLCVEVWNSKPESEGYAVDYESDVTVYRDGMKVTVPAGGVVKVTNGNSITLTPYILSSVLCREAES